MKYFFTFILLLFLGIGCKPKVLSGKELHDKLVETMDDYLQKNLKPGISFTIKELVYYPEVNKKLYDCKFYVYMHSNTVDTTGIMFATITNDFKEVVRTQ
ncbi:MAG TPA: hypothetical protein VIJ95_05535 [Hanamia sp.]